MNVAVGRLAETIRMFQAAWAASHHPARSPTRGSGEGGLWAFRRGSTRRSEVITDGHSGGLCTMLSPVMSRADERIGVSKKSNGDGLNTGPMRTHHKLLRACRIPRRLPWTAHLARSLPVRRA